MATPTTPPKVLVVEDDETLGGALARPLGLAGFACVAHRSAQEPTCGPCAVPRFSGPLDLLSERATARIDRDAREEGIDVLRKMRRR